MSFRSRRWLFILYFCFDLGEYLIRSSFSRGEADKLKAWLQVSITSTTGKWITLQELDCFSCTQTSLKIAPKRLLLSRMEAAAEESQLNIDTSGPQSTRFASTTSSLEWKGAGCDRKGNGQQWRRQTVPCPDLWKPLKTRETEGGRNRYPNASVLSQPQLKGGRAY